MIRKLVTFLGVVLSVWILYALQKSMPTYGDITSPIAIAGKTGEKITARNFELTVTRIRFAREIALSAFSNERSYSTSGVWAIVEADAAARDESITLAAAAWLGADGARYLASERISTVPALLTQQRLEPGLPQHALMIFEFPESEMRNAALHVAQYPFQPLDSEIHISTDSADGGVIHDRITLKHGRPGDDWSIEVP